MEIPYHNKDKMTGKYRKRVNLKTSKLRTDFIEISEKNSSQKIFSTQLNFTAKTSRSAVNLNFK